MGTVRLSSPPPPPPLDVGHLPSAAPLLSRCEKCRERGEGILCSVSRPRLVSHGKIFALLSINSAGVAGEKLVMTEIRVSN